VKEYPLDSDELWTLGGVNIAATVSFSIGYAHYQRYQDIQRDLELTQGLPDKLIGRWEAKRDGAFEIAMIAFAIGAVVVIFGGLKLWSIIRSTTHPDAPRRREAGSS